MSKNSLESLTAAIDFTSRENKSGYGKDYLKTLSKFIGELLAIDYVLIVKYVPEQPNMGESVAFHTPTGWSENIIYNLKDTPCKNIIGSSICTYESNIQALFPKDDILVQLNVESYLCIPLWGGDGMPIGLIALMNKGKLTDIKTIELVLKAVSISAGSELERIIHEQNIKISEERFNMLLQSSEDMITIHEPNGKYTYYNGPSYFDISPEEVIGKMPDELLEKEASDTLNKLFKQVRETGKGVNFEILLDWLGTKRWFSKYIYPVKNSAGEVVELVKVSRDIHLQKMAVKDIEKQNKQLSEFNTALNQAQKLSHVGSWKWNMATDEAEWSEEMYNIYGVTKENFCPSNENVTKTVVPEDLPKVEAGIGSLIKNEIFEPFEFRIKRPNGEIRNLYIVALEKYSKTNIFGVTQDITERKIAEQEIENKNKILVESKKELQALNEEYLTLNEELNESNNGLNIAKDKITASLAEKEMLLRELYHRTKNNMQVISSMLAIKSSYSNNHEIKEVLLETRSRIMGMALVHQKLYKASDLSWIDLKDYIQDLVELLKTNFLPKTSNLEIVTDLDNTHSNIDTAIPCGLIINELITNAIKYAFPNNQEGTITITLVNDHENKICISVSDNGKGIPSDIDYRNSNSYGLEAVIMLSEVQLGGTISLDTKDGTKFTIKFKESLKADRV